MRDFVTNKSVEINRSVHGSDRAWNSLRSTRLLFPFPNVDGTLDQPDVTAAETVDGLSHWDGWQRAYFSPGPCDNHRLRKH